MGVLTNHHFQANYIKRRKESIVSTKSMANSKEKHENIADSHITFYNNMEKES